MDEKQMTTSITLTVPNSFKEMDEAAFGAFAASEPFAKEAIKLMRWPPHGGPICTRCNCDAVYYMPSRDCWRCKSCYCQFTITSGTWMASSKLSFRALLTIIWHYSRSEGRLSPSQLKRLLGSEYKTAYVWIKKLQGAGAVSSPVSRDWKGYWQRGSADN